MTSVEFRFLQFVISHVTGDRVSVGLLHWDGEQLRVTWAFDHLAVCEPAQRDAARASVRVLMRRAERAGERLGSSPVLPGVGLKTLFPVREGLGGALFWSAVTSTRTTDPSRHFEELARSLRGVQRKPRSKHVSARSLRVRIAHVAEGLRREHPESVRVEHPVKQWHEYVSPLSWKNGVWRHAVPCSYEGLTPDEMAKATEGLVGMTGLVFPRREVAVFIAVLPQERSLAAVARQEFDFLATALGKRCSQLFVGKRAGELNFDELVRVVRHDVHHQRK